MGNDDTHNGQFKLLTTTPTSSGNFLQAYLHSLILGSLEKNDFTVLVLFDHFINEYIHFRLLFWLTLYINLKKDQEQNMENVNRQM